MSNQKLIEKLSEAQDKILEAIETLKFVAKQHKLTRNWAEAYIISHLLTVTTSEHEYLDSSNNIDDWIKSIQEDEEE